MEIKWTGDGYPHMNIKENKFIAERSVFMLGAFRLSGAVYPGAEKAVTSFFM